MVVVTIKMLFNLFIDIDILLVSDVRSSVIYIIHDQSYWDCNEDISRHDTMT